jgi:hypothetical protein
MLIGQASAVGTNRKAKELGGGISDARFRSVKGDVVGHTCGEEFFEVDAKLVDVVCEAQPIVHVVREVLE